MSSTDRRCDPRFPAKGVLLDTSALVRLWKCDALEALRSTVELHVLSQVAREFKKSAQQRSALEKLDTILRTIDPGTPAWNHLCLLRGGNYSTRNLGEAESIAVALADSDGGVLLPFVTYDDGATKLSSSRGIVTIDFLDTLSWLVSCAVLAVSDADAIATRATALDGWRPPHAYAGSIDTIRGARQAAVVARVDAWRASSS